MINSCQESKQKFSNGDRKWVGPNAYKRQATSDVEEEKLLIIWQSVSVRGGAHVKAKEVQAVCIYGNSSYVLP